MTDTEALGQIQADLGHLKSDVSDIKTQQSHIYTLLNGRGGIVSDVAVLKEQMKSAPSLRRTMTAGAVWGGIVAASIVLGSKALNF